VLSADPPFNANQKTDFSIPFSDGSLGKIAPGKHPVIQKWSFNVLKINNKKFLFG